MCASLGNLVKVIGITGGYLLFAEVKCTVYCSLRVCDTVLSVAAQVPLLINYVLV